MACAAWAWHDCLLFATGVVLAYRLFQHVAQADPQRTLRDHVEPRPKRPAITGQQPESFPNESSLVPFRLADAGACSESRACRHPLVHYHVGKEAVFPFKLSGVAKASDTLDTKIEQDYCWMWSNKSARHAKLGGRVTREQKARRRTGLQN